MLRTLSGAVTTPRALDRRRGERDRSVLRPSVVLAAPPHTREAVVDAVNHELRTPLTTVVGYVEMLLDGEAGRLGEDQARMLQRVSANAQQLLVSVEQLLVVCNESLLHSRHVDLATVVVAALGGHAALEAGVAGLSPAPGGPRAEPAPTLRG